MKISEKNASREKKRIVIYQKEAKNCNLKKLTNPNLKLTYGRGALCQVIGTLRWNIPEERVNTPTESK